MALERKVAIIHKNPHLIGVLAAMAQVSGFAAVTMTVDRTTTPQQVATFVTAANPSLVLLAENYGGGRFDPSVVAGQYLCEGLEALAEIKRARSTLPVFMVSSGEKHYDEVERRGGNGYLQIPVELEEFGQFLASNTQS